MKFIKLRNGAGTYIRINMDLIESYGTIATGNHKGKTFLIPVNMPEESKPYIVLDDPEEIDQLILRSVFADHVECSEDIYADA